jgi:hypothetical protein
MMNYQSQEVNHVIDKNSNKEPDHRIKLGLTLGLSGKDNTESPVNGTDYGKKFSQNNQPIINSK